MTSNARTHALAGIFALLLVASCVAAAFTESDSLTTALGAVAGASAALLVSVLLLTWMSARSRRRETDRRTLDALDPLSAARRDGR